MDLALIYDNLAICYPTNVLATTGLACLLLALFLSAILSKVACYSVSITMVHTPRTNPASIVTIYQLSKTEDDAHTWCTPVRIHTVHHTVDLVFRV